MSASMVVRVWIQIKVKIQAAGNIHEHMPLAVSQLELPANQLMISVFMLGQYPM